MQVPRRLFCGGLQRLLLPLLLQYQAEPSSHGSIVVRIVSLSGVQGELCDLELPADFVE